MKQEVSCSFLNLILLWEQELMTDKTIILKVSNLSKRFGGIQALKEISLDIRYGEVHALVGENGAGKTTLMNVLGGIIRRDEGEVVYKDQPVEFNSPMESLNAGVAIIHQELAMLPSLNVIDNMFMGRMKSKGGIISWSQMEQFTRQYLAQVGLEVDPYSIIRELSISQRQLIEIAKAVSMNANLIIMDEPNSSLSESETERLFQVIEQLKQREVAVIYVSHKINEVLRISDRISVLRDGQYIGTLDRQSATIDAVIEMMVGRKVRVEEFKRKGRSEVPLLQVEGLCGAKFQDVSFTLYEGEILGFAGLVGAGRSEVAKAIFGADPITSGRVLVDGKPVRYRLPKDAIAAGLAMVQEDRKVLSLFMDMSILYNISMAQLPWMGRVGFIKGRVERETAESFVSRLNIRLSEVFAPVSSLSGGNQQKTVLARWLASNPRILILDEPTHGIDIGAKSEIFQLMRNLAEQGIGILLISSELPEIMAMSDRIAVMRGGRLAGILDHAEATENKIMTLATSQAYA
jgi:ribose transport system ATP-binding protein